MANGRWARVIAVALVAQVGAGLGLAGCSSDEPADDTRPAQSKSPTSSTLPLTGEVIDGPVPDRGALVVKLDNTGDARPQVGLGSADLVVEELVEGGRTRLAAFFHSQRPELVGPVRSLRDSDVGIVSPTGGLLAASGGARVAVRRVTGAGVPIATPDNAGGFFRDGKRRAPYNLMLRPPELTDKLSELAPPGDYLAWAKPDAAPPQGKPATSARIEFSPSQRTSWTFTDGRGWTRRDDLAADDDAFVATSVLVLRVRTRDAGYRDPAGNPVPETLLEGSGAATLLHAGQAVPARWSKGGAKEPVTLTTATGARLLMPPGHTWIELVPEAGSIVTRPRSGGA